MYAMGRHASSSTVGRQILLGFVVVLLAYTAYIPLAMVSARAAAC